MSLAKRYFEEFKKQSELIVTLEEISDNEFKIHFYVKTQVYLHTIIEEHDINIETHVANLLKSEDYKEGIKCKR